jgi:hypothetical protein
MRRTAGFSAPFTMLSNGWASFVPIVPASLQSSRRTLNGAWQTKADVYCENAVQLTLVQHRLAVDETLASLGLLQLKP